MPRKIVLVALTASMFVACGGSSSGSGNTVVMNSAQRFEPDSITVKVGDTVTWTNEDSQTHTVTAFDDGIPDGAEYFASGGAPNEEAARDDLQTSLIPVDDTYEVTFDEPGSYGYFCIPHEQQGMKGEIVVEP